jgi:hypothetical protein
MSSSPKKQQMKAHGKLFKPTGLHGSNNYNNNNTNNKRNPKKLKVKKKKPKAKKNLPLSTLSNKK